ncbi:MAG: hypothetical protein M0P73_15250 [Syntrophobacterales bacterium]|nr:hypothetical protein [Syntrophobacterales bacterium]
MGNDPNVRGLYVDFGEPGPGGMGQLSKGIFQIASEFGPFVTPGDAFRHYAKAAGHDSGNGRPDRPPPTMGHVEAFQKNLAPEVLQYLHEKRGLTDASIAKFRVGWCTKKERNTFPVFDVTPDGPRLVNIRYHNSKKEPKTLNWSGYGQKRLWGLDRLAAAPPGSTVVITEGEFDAMLVEQETGYIGVSSTNGSRSFQAEWSKHFVGHHLVVLYDCDKEGAEAVHNLVVPAFEELVKTGQVPSLRVVWLYDLQKIDKKHKDATDWIVKDGGSGARLKEMVQQAAPHIYTTPTSHLEPPVPIKGFEQIDYEQYAGRRVTVPIQVFGENTVAYHAVTKVRVTNCGAIKDGKCSGVGPEGNIRSCLKDILVPLGDRVMIASVRATEGQLKKHLQEYVCDKDRRPAIRVEDQDRTTIREVYAHQVVGPMAPERLELVEKPVYVIGGGMVEIGKYQATGRVVTSYRDQQPTMIVDKLDRLEEDYQAFTLEKGLSSLEKLRQMEPGEIIEDLSLHVTRIYEREAIHRGVLLTLCSPLWIDFPGDGRIRGWLAAITVGDTGTGKTSISQGIFDYAKVGSRVSGITASRTGLTYACEHDERKGWRVKAGAFLKMSRQALIVDEAQDIKQDELKTMAEGMDTGLTRIDRIQNKVFESCTRVIFNCNPKDQRHFWEQRTMDSYRYCCESIKGIFPVMMIRRIDLAMFVASWDIEDKEKIYFPKDTQENPRRVEPEDLQALIFYAWNLKPEQIVWSTEDSFGNSFDTAGYVKRIAQYLSNKFAGADDLPIVYAEDFRKTMARLSVASAILDLSTSEDFSQVIVQPQHVSSACEFLEDIYEAENCDLGSYTRSYLLSHSIEYLPQIQKEIDRILDGPESAARRFRYIIGRLWQCPDGETVKKSEIVEEFDVEAKTIQRDMKFFLRNHLVNSNAQKGYRPEPKFNRVMRRLRKIDPARYSFDISPQEFDKADVDGHSQ